jgi:hypothetical protein
VDTIQFDDASRSKTRITDIAAMHPKLCANNGALGAEASLLML